MAKLEIGGKYGNQIMFKGNKRFLPAGICHVINVYFNQWNALKDLAQLPELMRELGDCRADKHFLGTDWEALNKLYEAHMQRFTLIFTGSAEPGAPPRLVVRGAQRDIARPLHAILTEYCQQDGTLQNNFDLWRLDKLLRRAKAQLKSDRSFVIALKRFSARAVSLEESLSFFRQIQAYHAPEFLAPELKTVLGGYIDAVHTLREPLKLAELVEALKSAGAELRVHASVAPVLAHYEELARAGAAVVGTDGGAGILQDTVAAASRRRKDGRRDATPTGKEDGQNVRPTGKEDRQDACPTGKSEDPRVAVQLGDALKTQLYAFQREGVAFLTVNRRALLADDMGLGKTLQAIAGALVLKRTQGLKRALIVCPSSVKYQWQSEIQRFTSERCEVIGGDREERAQIYRAAASRGLYADLAERPLFYVTNYELVFRDIEEIKALGAELLILDEAQRVKNFRTKTAQAVFGLPAPFLFVLTGTPLENQLMELYTIMRFIDERALGKNPLAFRDRYVVLDRFGGIVGYKLVEEVTRKIAAVTLRRTKTQALDQLPPLVEQERWLELTEVQRQIYKELQGQARSVLSEKVWDSVATNNALTALMRLREVCDSPELIDPAQTESQKLAELKALVEDEVGALDRQVIIFTQWTRMGEIIIRELRAAGLAPSFLHGGIPTEKRRELVERFQNGKDRVFVSTDAGGTGLNLQCASLVVNYDLPFNPAKLNQRIGRAHRLGQKETVFVVNLLCRNTVETKLLKMLKEKQALFDDVFGEISDPAQAKAATPVQRSLRELLLELLE